ncbi:hypothetical protein [Chitinophaga sp. S165]|uniref:hypothetical protein n=1 Tax=Chitinophaga sp. S165 TaxID=2135462 RepID=UPI000D858A49|nr:hypothetical protein [Chitinophaga sp. S165]PWV45898.1 hypothetical protein C7475_112115 [Chitinophaga sp. S165]
MENALVKKKKCTPKRKRPKSYLFSIKVLNGEGRKYVLNFPLLSVMTKEAGQYMILNDMLAMIAVGRTRAEARQDFVDLFDYVYQRYNEFPEKELNEKRARIKALLNNTVRRIIVAS